jgi:hypothetical protein
MRAELIGLRCWLVAALGHKRFRAEPIQLREPLSYVRDLRLEQYAVAHTANADMITPKVKLFRQAYGLAATVAKQLRYSNP